ncbi:MAG: DUF11 domain-containing protein [Actinobacteria bacterium]|nr:DUF11 domain-containing protein [Actinomycetota bacterium]
MLRRGIVFGVLAVLVAGVFAGPASAAPALTVESISWNVIGLDSPQVNTGPNRFLQGGRVCNTGDETATGLVTTFVWDTANPFIAVEGPTSLSDPALAPGDCVDAYFLVTVTRDAAAFGTTRAFHLEVTADGGVAASSTTIPLYVEELISQNRNDSISVDGPQTVYVGGTYTYTATSSTAPGGYEQLSSFLDWPTSMFRIVDVETSLSEPPGTVLDTTYADACGWDPVTRTCTGTGKAGGDIVTVYTVEVVGAGTATLRNLIYDFSGASGAAGSFHYNADYDADVPPLSSSITIQALEAPDLAIAKGVASSLVAGRSGTYQLTVTNVGPSATSGTVTVTDELPDGLTFVAATADGWDCAHIDGTVTCTTDAAIAPGEVTLLAFEVEVAATAADTVTNVATVQTELDRDPTNDTATTTDPVLRPGLAVAKSADPAAGTALEPGDRVTYTVEVSNPGTATTTGIVLTDPLPDGVTPVTATLGGEPVEVEALEAGMRLPDLAPGTSHTLLLTVDVDDRGQTELVNLATATGDGVPATSSEVRHPVNATAALAVAKDASVTSVAPGGAISYTVTVTSEGPHTARDVRLVDVVPDGTTYVAGSVTVDGAPVPDGGSDPLAGGLPLGDLAPGRVVVVTFDVDVAPDAGGVLVNVARGTGTGVDTPAMDEAVTTVEEAAAPDDETGAAGELPATGLDEHPDLLFWSGSLSLLLGMLLVAAANAIGPSREVYAER